MITFIEHKEIGYPGRTIENIKRSSATIAIAVDFNSGGEVLTRNKCLSMGKPYLGISFRDLIKPRYIDLAKRFIKDYYGDLNIAGNREKTFRGYGYSQPDIDERVLSFLSSIKDELSLLKIRSGGQSGVDEAALKAADLLNIPSECILPKGWMFQNPLGESIQSREMFISRFNSNNIKYI